MTDPMRTALQSIVNLAMTSQAIPEIRRIAEGALDAPHQPTRDATEGAGLEKLARTIAQADFIWELGESGVMACSPELAGQQFDQAYDGGKKRKYLHIAQVVSATPATPQPAPDAMREALIRAQDVIRRYFRQERPATLRTSANQVLHEIKDALSAPVPPADGAGETKKYKCSHLWRSFRC